MGTKIGLLSVNVKREQTFRVASHHLLVVTCMRALLINTLLVVHHTTRTSLFNLGDIASLFCTRPLPHPQVKSVCVSLQYQEGCSDNVVLCGFIEINQHDHHPCHSRPYILFNHPNARQTCSYQAQVLIVKSSVNSSSIILFLVCGMSIAMTILILLSQI